MHLKTLFIYLILFRDNGYIRYKIEDIDIKFKIYDIRYKYSLNHIRLFQIICAMISFGILKNWCCINIWLLVVYIVQVLSKPKLYSTHQKIDGFWLIVILQKKKCPRHIFSWPDTWSYKIECQNMWSLQWNQTLA